MESPEIASTSDSPEAEDLQTQVEAVLANRDAARARAILANPDAQIGLTPVLRARLTRVVADGVPIVKAPSGLPRNMAVRSASPTSVLTVRRPWTCPSDLSGCPNDFSQGRRQRSPYENGFWNRVGSMSPVDSLAAMVVGCK